MHLDLSNAVPLAGLAPAALDIEGETALFVAAHLRVDRPREEIADHVENSRIGRGI